MQNPETHLLSLLADLLTKAKGDPRIGDIHFDGEALEIEVKDGDETVQLAIQRRGIARCYPEDTPQETLKRLLHEFEQTQTKYREYGAHDTEPDAIFQSVLVAAATQGINRVPKDGNGWDLYSTSMNCTEASAALTAKAEEIVQFILSLTGSDRRIIKAHLEDYCWRIN